MRIGHPTATAVTMMALAALVLPACGGDEDAGTTTEPTTTVSPAGGGSVAITLSEFAVAADPPSVPAAGPVTFEVTNDGPKDPHEFVVIATDAAITDLPTDKDGAVVEGEVEVVDEIEDIPVGETESLTVDLAAGTYALICNIVEEEDGTVEAHYSEGMRTGFAVA